LNRFPYRHSSTGIIWTTLVLHCLQRSRAIARCSCSYRFDADADNNNIINDINPFAWKSVGRRKSWREIEAYGGPPANACVVFVFQRTRTAIAVYSPEICRPVAGPEFVGRTQPLYNNDNRMTTSECILICNLVQWMWHATLRVSSMIIILCLPSRRQTTSALLLHAYNDNIIQSHSYDNRRACVTAEVLY